MTLHLCDEPRHRHAGVAVTFGIEDPACLTTMLKVAKGRIGLKKSRIPQLYFVIL